MNKATQKLGASPILKDGTQQREIRKKKTSISAISRRSESVRVSANPRSESLSINDFPPHLQIVSVPIEQRVDPERNSYILLIQPVGIRAAGGQWSAEEAHEIARVTRGWDFSPGEDGDPQCLGKLEALLDRICKKGGEV